MQDAPKTNAAKARLICPLFESELLLELMLRYWNHPFADNADFRGNLLETVTDVLTAASEGLSDCELIPGLPTAEMNFVAAVWYVEHCAVNDANGKSNVSNRVRWLNAIRRSLPSCFCDPNSLI